MKGVNKLEFNQETIIEAAQEYLNKRLNTFAGRQIVTTVTFVGGVYIVVTKAEEVKCQPTQN